MTVEEALEVFDRGWSFADVVVVGLAEQFRTSLAQSASQYPRMVIMHAMVLYIAAGLEALPATLRGDENNPPIDLNLLPGFDGTSNMIALLRASADLLEHMQKATNDGGQFTVQ